MARILQKTVVGAYKPKSHFLHLLVKKENMVPGFVRDTVLLDVQDCEELQRIVARFLKHKEGESGKVSQESTDR